MPTSDAEVSLFCFTEGSFFLFQIAVTCKLSIYFTCLITGYLFAVDELTTSISSKSICFVVAFGLEEFLLMNVM